jgi:methyl-accepting chemotaxis protein
MFTKILRVFNSRLWIKIMLPVFVIVSLVIGISIGFNISFQQKLGIQQLAFHNKTLAHVVEGSMFDALAVGDNDTVRLQFERFHRNIPDIKMFVYDFNGKISFATDINSVGNPIDDYIGAGSASAVNRMLKTGEDSDQPFYSMSGATSYIADHQVIKNEAGCYHCHGSTNQILGGISILSPETEIRAGINKGRTINVLIGGIGLVLIILFIWLFFHFFVNSKVILIMDAVARMRQGDFSRDTDIGQGDEMNHILARINMVNQELRTALGQVKDGSQSMLTSASELDSISDTLGRASTDTAQKTSALSTAAEEMSINNRAISEAMNQSASSINTIASAIEEMSSTVNEIAQNVNSSKEITTNVVAEFSQIEKTVYELGRKADDVDEVTNEIRSIAEQVSMLALNAKIEAARAGEAGKGFAVVAQEITALALDTNQATLDADKTLLYIKQVIKDTIDKVQKMTRIIQQADESMSSISAAVEEQNVTTREISQNIGSVSNDIAEVNSSVTQGAQVANDIAKDIALVENDTRNVQDNSSKLNVHAGELSKMAEGFRELLRKFTI